MDYFGLNREQNFFEKLKQGLGEYKKQGLSVKFYDKDLFKPDDYHKHDIVIYKWNNALAVIEFKKHSQRTIFDPFNFSLDNESALARFEIVVTPNDTVFVNDKYKKNEDFNELSFDQLIQTIANPDPIKFGELEKLKIKNVFLELQEELFSDNIVLRRFINQKEFTDCLSLKDNSFSCYFEDSRTGISEFENQFFIALLGKFEDNQICRYTTINTIFSMLNYMSFRMNGLVGMNDKSEVNYVDTYLKGFEKPLIDEHHSRISALNRRYITSCTSIKKKDDLTMWRLYADDSQGVCLTFSVNTKKTNDHVLIQKVRYADKNGKHPELEYLLAVQNRISNALGFSFQFRKLGIWKHFFKAYEYEIEDEVRLMVIDDDKIPKIKTDWVLTFTHTILNPIIDFQLNSSVFPIQLKEIMLGPKCPEQEINKVQLEEMLRQKRKHIRENNKDSSKSKIDSKLDKINIELSSIKHYR
ncbi:DUF2971 domain-containing protein [Flagellimonas iocasae]|uniref:DUF2971 domain-containing protein n=1 Tax=Flagellimonas iocasae TaxID=2055905 RepID=A0ABW4XW72_9FLAO